MTVSDADLERTPAGGGVDMPIADDGRPHPMQHIAAGLFFLAWACVGWISVAMNALMFSDVYAGLDPGPSLMPLVVLTILSAGGAAITLGGVVGAFRARASAAPPAGRALTARLRPHAVPAAFLATLVVYPTVMQAIGYVAATAVFVLGWILALTAWRTLARTPGRLLAVAVAVLATVVVVGILYGGFVVVIHTPLP